MTRQALDAVAETLAQRIGLRSDGTARSRLERELLAGARAAGVTPERFAEQLRGDEAALGALIDRVTVQESSFFRHPEQFDVLRELLAAAGTTGTVWSAGCANGQEAWSLAILIDELGLPGWRVLATDVSERALERARRGTYDERELRGLSPARRRRYTTEAPGGCLRVADGLREHVHFQVHNLVGAPPPLTHTRCRLVLCRNVLIYLREKDRERVLEQMRDLLRPDGVLLVGAGEALLGDNPSFSPERSGKVFLYRPRSAPPVSADGTAPARPQPLPAATKPAQPRERRPMPAALPSVGDLLREGERLAAAGDHASAAAAFRRATYLDPDDPIAHVSLGLSLQRVGSTDAAKRAFRAARAAMQRGPVDGVESRLDGWAPGELANLLTQRLGMGG